MAERFQIPNSLPITPPSRPLPVKRTSQPAKEAAPDFAALLHKELEASSIRFSAHAEKRLAARRIHLTPNQIASLEQAVDRLQAKGGRESLIIMGDVAFVVSVRNRTVITAVDGDSMKENVFTNIDSAIVS
ncbi:MAG: TIGR02530 family flagellar biosynthesis protein [Limnochordia bacterium]|jgi:flagellar operon protein